METPLAHLPQAPVILEAGEGPEFQVQLALAKSGGARVIVAHRDWSKRQKVVVDGVEHMDDVLASLECLAGMPSNQGRRSRLEDTIHALHGNMIEPTH